MVTDTEIGMRTLWRILRSISKLRISLTAIIRTSGHLLQRRHAMPQNAVEKAVLLYYAVRDGIRYDPYYPFYLPVHYRASVVLKGRRGFCVPKVSLLCAAGRACGIPSRAGFATVRNHLATPQLLEFMGSDLFVFHGFTEFFLEGKWVKATPAFNRELCKRSELRRWNSTAGKIQSFIPRMPTTQVYGICRIPRKLRRHSRRRNR